MERINHKIKLYIQLGFFVIIWISLLLVGGTTSLLDFVNLFKKFPLAVTIYGFFALIFVKWAWRWKIINWFIKIPDLQGTWKGNIISTWVDPETNSLLDSIPATLSIKQTFNTIDCFLYTKESLSYSTAAEINLDKGGNLYLNYNYTNRPRATVRDRSEIHDGAAVLQIIKESGHILDGEYWTSRKSTGDMRFKFSDKSVTDRFIE